MSTRSLTGLLFVFVVLFFFLGCAKQPAEKEIRISKDSIEVVFEGLIMPTREEKLIAPSSVRVHRIYVDNAKRVFQNQKIIELDKKELDLAYRQAVLNYERTRVASEYHTARDVTDSVITNNAKERLIRTYELYSSGFASRAELKAAENEYQMAKQAEDGIVYANAKERFETGKAYRAAQKDIQKAALEVEKARYNLDHSVITAPFDGYLTDFRLAAGEMLSAKETIGRVINIDDVVLKGEFSPGIYKYVKTDMSVKVSCFTVPAHVTSGLIKEISPVVDPSTGRLSLYIPLKNQDYILQPGTKCLISMVMPKSQAEKAGLDTAEEKVHIKSEIRSYDVKPQAR